jgi:tRNA-2-methylthio-N6-dimethylallyladenosine synthase
MEREHRREEHLERIAWIKMARRPISIPTDMIVKFSGREGGGFRSNIESGRRGRVRCGARVQILPRPNTPAISLADGIPEQE